MAKKNASSERDLKATIVQLRADLEQSEAKRTRWKKRATKAETALADLQTQLRRTEKRARKALEKAQSIPPSDGRADTPTPAASSPPDLGTTDGPTGPDASWTVAQLRAEARARGLTGLSGKSKADLLEALA